MNRQKSTAGDANLWCDAQRTPAQLEFGYAPQPSGLPAWRYEFPHRSSSVSPEFTDPAAVPAPGNESNPAPLSPPVADRVVPPEQSG